MPFFPLLPPSRQNRVEFFLGLFLLISQPGRFLKILRLDCALFFPANDFDFFFDLLHVGRPGHRINARARAGLVHHINRLVRQKSSGDVALGKFHRSLKRFVGQLGFVMRFILWPQSFQNLDRFLDRRRIHFHGLEPSLQGRVFFDVLAILVQGGCAHTLQLAPAQCRLDDVTRVHRALGRTGPDNRVQLIDEQDHVFAATNFVHHRFDSFLELAAIFRPRHHQCQIERDDFFVAQKLRHVAGRNFLRQSFHDSGFAHTSLTEQYRIIFRAPAKHLNDALDFVFPADHRVELAFLRQVSQIAPERTQGRRFYIFFSATRGAGGFICLPFRRREIRIEFLQNLVACALDIDLEALQHPRRDALTFAQQSQQNVLCPNV